MVLAFRGRMPMTPCRFSSVSMMAIALMVGGCRFDECQQGESRCDGDGLTFCRGSESRSFRFEDGPIPCSTGHCVDTVQGELRAALCVLDPAPAPLCAPQDG